MLWLLCTLPVMRQASLNVSHWLQKETGVGGGALLCRQGQIKNSLVSRYCGIMAKGADWRRPHWRLLLLETAAVGTIEGLCKPLFFCFRSAPCEGAEGVS